MKQFENRGIVHFGREISGELSIAEEREWIITNGIGGYGSGSVVGSMTRGYHGILVAALRPPIDRHLMVAKLEETITYQGNNYPLTTNRWGGGSVSPAGFKHQQSFELEGSIPLWRFACGNALLEKRVWMEYAANTTYVAFTLLEADEPVSLKLSAVINNRGFHNTGEVILPTQKTQVPDGIKVNFPGDEAPILSLLLPNAQVDISEEIYQNFYLPVETTRGLNDLEGHVHVGDFTIELKPGQTLTFMVSIEDAPSVDDEALDRRRKWDKKILQDWTDQQPDTSPSPPAWIRQLALATDQFIVKRHTATNAETKSIIAGYHWFEDWGRDTMISLPGLALVTGRHEDAAAILETFSDYISQGMLPNRFPDASETPEYNTIDATLWYFQAIRSYYDTTKDKTLLAKLFPKLTDIIEWHLKGTRFGIKVDPVDNLLSGGQEGVQLTWMDAKVDGLVITPRIGKPVEVNALWYNALKATAFFASELTEDPTRYENLASATLSSFSRFWNDEAGYCFDVLDGPQGNEHHLRPNQLLAVSLPESPLSEDQQRAVVTACSSKLLTSNGLRTLAADDADYRGFYGGDQFHRDSAYHQGTVWPWLLGPFVKAHLRVFKDPARAFRFLAPLEDHLLSAGVGTISEIFTGDAPFTPKGCISQAWSVAQVLEAYHLLIQSTNAK